MQWGESLTMLEDIYESTGLKPKTLELRPTLAELWEFPMECWRELASSRQYSMNGPLPIPITALTAYAWLYQFDHESARDMWELVQKIDRIWLTEFAKKQEKQAPNGKAR